MRTTLEIEDDVLAAARAIAAADGTSVGRTLSVLARRGLAPSRSGPVRNGLPVFEVGDDARPIGPADVEAALEDG